MSAVLTTAEPPPRHPILAGATWTRAANPRGVVFVNGEEMGTVFACNEQVGLAAAFVLTPDGKYRLDAPGRYMIRRLHGIIRIEKERRP